MSKTIKYLVLKNYLFSPCVVTKLCLQVAECGEGGEMAGVIRACIKTVTRGSSGYVKLAYILGLRVSPSHRSLSFFLSKIVCTSLFS